MGILLVVVSVQFIVAFLAETLYDLFMKVQRVYIDTSVLGGCFDTESAEWSNALMGDFRSGRLKPVLSDVVKLKFRTHQTLCKRSTSSY